MQNIIIDIGNTRTKISYFLPENKINTVVCNSNENDIIKIVQQLIKQKNELKFCILSSVINLSSGFIKKFDSYFEKFIQLSHKTKIPIKNKYESKKTLGNDRLAAVIGANYLFPNTNLLVIDSGTAITIDFINKHGEYIGGNISPGLSLRFKALNTFTGKLPLEKITIDYKLIGKDSKNAIISGVQNGIVFEIKGYITEFGKKFKDLHIIFTGGDMFFFVEKLKKTIFAESNLVTIGLNRILEYNL